MTLRLQLLLAALCTLALPWAGWRVVGQTEQLLREGQQQAWLTAARLLAGTVQARGLQLPAGDLLFVQTLREPLRVDGYGDDWRALQAQAQALGPPQDVHKLQVSLARRDGDLYLFAQVRDATRVRFDPTDPRSVSGDHLTLVLGKDGRSARYRLISAAPGSFTAAAQGDAGELPAQLVGALQEDGSGYRIELRIARGLVPTRLGLAVYDSAQPGPDAPELRELVGYDEALAQGLHTLLPAHTRARVVLADGWVLADAGELRARELPPAQRPGGFSAWLYRHWFAPPAQAAQPLDGNPPRLDVGEVWQALSGVAATSWRPADQADAVVLAAAVPLVGGPRTHAALVLEQANASLPLLADRALSGLLSATLVAFVVAAAVLLLFGALLSLRIRRLRNATEQALRAGGRLDASMPLIEARDELGDLARSFRRLLDEIGASTDYLRTLASKLSHELNTPLAIVKSSLDNLDHQALPGDARPYLLRARDGADRLGVIVRAMSEASRVERAIAAAEAEDFDLRALVAGCAESYRALCAPRELRLQLPPAPLPLHGAPELIAQALDKLFDNACSFTPATGWIALALEVGAEGGARIRVANAGPALPAAMHERVFDSLVSLRERAAPGGATPHLGLGLYVVRLVADLHRGHASAANRVEGDGVEFTLTLAGMPRRSLSAATEPVAPG
ncbi:MAG: HAMP domain-containing protein [Dokdonella sp.]|nr:MAG: HAMP domain-containing protein [Dokdonella sp.]